MSEKIIKPPKRPVAGARALATKLSSIFPKVAGTYLRRETWS